VHDTTEFIIPPAALRLVRSLRRREKKNKSLLAMTVGNSGDTILNSRDKFKK
jgi:hypothetical protein